MKKMLYLCTRKENRPMAKNFYFVVQSWMLDEMNLKLSEAAVYAYIHGLTNSEELGRQGWHGSKRRMAKVLHTSPSTINDIIKRLYDKGFIHIANGFITSTINRDIPSKEANVRNPDTISPQSDSDMPF